MPLERNGKPEMYKNHAGHSTQLTAALRAHIAAHTVPHTTQRAWLNVVPPHHGVPSEVGLQFFCFWLRGFYFTVSSHVRITWGKKSVVPAVQLSNYQELLIYRN